MIKSLKYEVTFPSTGKTLSNDLTFDLGMTAIVGANGRGKSFLIEMIRYCYFGSSALRSTGDQYQNLKAEMSWGDFRVIRNGTKTTLFRDEVVVAVGTTAVNKKIVEVLGFGLKVFDIACSLNQDEITALSKMLPTERKKIVDDVSGLSFLVELGKWANDQAKDEGTRAEALEGVLVKPVEPVKSGTYVPSPLLAEQVTGLEALVHEMNQIQGWLSSPRKPPVEPVKPNVTESIDELEVLVAARATVVAERASVEASLKRLPSAPKVGLPEDAEAQLDAWDRWQERSSFLRSNPQPRYTSVELDKATDNQMVVQYKLLLKQIAEHESSCPSCGFDLSGDHVASLRKKADFFFGYSFHEDAPSLSTHEIEGARRTLENWTAVADQWAAFKDIPEVTQPRFTRKDVDNARFETDRKNLTAQLQSFVIPADRSPDLRTLHVYQIAQESYAQEKKVYAQHLVERATKEQRLEELKPLTSNLPALKAELELSRSYERDLANYTKAHNLYETKLAEVTTLRNSEASWRKVKAALDELRTRVKSYLTPALSKVASRLLSEMSCGAFSGVLITDEFELFIDGQPDNTLSGSERAIVNIALRVALGQILTNRVLPFLSLDEPDGSMDEDRAEATAEAIRSLTKFISQIFIVSHKHPEADAYIRF